VTAPSARERFRRLIPRRLRAVLRAGYRFASGYYLRQIGAVAYAVNVQNAEIEGYGEILDLVLRRLRRVEEEIGTFNRTLSGLEEYEAALRRLDESYVRVATDLNERLLEMKEAVRSVAPLSLAASMSWNVAPEAALAEEDLVITKSFSDFYVSFQNRYRGSEEEIRERQRARARYFSRCQRVLDIGCGRGEFLEVLREHSIPGEGIDLNPGSVDVSRAKGLTVHQADAIAYLNAESGESFDGIHMSHLLEHVAFPTAIRLLEESVDHLKPGGVLAVETPNPHCAAALQAFFLDPTHVRPLFPEALAVLLESLNMEHVEVHFLSPTETGNGNVERHPQDFADYLIIGTKALGPIDPSDKVRGQRRNEKSASLSLQDEASGSSSG
jgi:SAM-dependent methyltransferase